MQAKRKLTALLLSLCMVLGMLPMTVFAAGDTTTSGLNYEINGNSVTITGSAWETANVTIPSEIEGKPVTAIGEKAFYQNYTLTSVEIPNSVTSIGTSAFHLCSNLTNVTFEEGSKLSSIGAGAFYWCTKLTDITIPDGVTSIGNSVFYKTGLQNINIPAGVTSIEEGAFWKCDKLESITFEGRTAPVLDGDVFFECTVLTVVNVPCGADGYTEANGWPEDKVQYEHVWAEDWTSDGTHHWKACTAEGCAEKDQYGVHQIANGVCTVCKVEVETSGVQTYAVKVNGITVTSANASDILGDADGLGATVSYDPDTNTLTLNNATLTVSEGFAAIHALIPNLTIVLKGENQINGSGSTENGIYSNGNLTITGDGILKTEGTGFGLYGNTTITITGGADVNILVTFSSANAPQPYSAVRALRGLTVDGADLTAWNKGENGTVYGAPGISASLTAKNGADVRIVSTNYDAIPHSLAASGEGTKVLAYSESSDHYGIGADGVEGTITISDGATVTAYGGKGAMKSKPDLTGYTNPYIKAGAYTDSATEVTDPANTDYHMNTFVEIKAGETPIDSFTYEINGESVTITGYTGSEENVTIPSEIEGKPVTAIGERAFSQNKTLTSVAIPDSVTSIGVKAFYKSGLENINIPAGVTTIGISAFEECFNLSGVTFEKDSKLTEIKSGTFLGCGKVTSIEIPAGVTSIGIMAFYFCSDLTSVTFEEGSQLSSIRESAFERCTGLTDITIPDGVTSIRSRAFNGCEKLGSITFTGNTAPELEADDVFGKVRRPHRHSCALRS